MTFRHCTCSWCTFIVRCDFHSNCVEICFLSGWNPAWSKRRWEQTAFKARLAANIQDYDAKILLLQFTDAHLAKPRPPRTPSWFWPATGRRSCGHMLCSQWIRFPYRVSIRKIHQYLIKFGIFIGLYMSYSLRLFPSSTELAYLLVRWWSHQSFI